MKARLSRRLFLTAVATLVALAAGEWVVVPVGFRILTGRALPVEDYRHEIYLLSLQSLFAEPSHANGLSEAVPAYLQNYVPHPYVGFAHDLDKRPGGPAAATILGWQREAFETREDRIVIVYFGGSFAAGIFEAAHRQIAQAVEKVSGGRQVVSVSLALGGMKQPQQLMSLAFLLASGGGLDIAVNIDGFNEVGIPATELVPANISPLFPRGWPYWMEAAASQGERSRGRIERAKRDRLAWAGSSVGNWAGWSNLGLLAWRWGDQQRLEEIQRQNEAALTTLAGPEVSAAATGPRPSFASDEESYSELAAIWGRASHQMHHIAQANDVIYLHYLQPNQHFDGLKPMSAKERAVAIAPDQGYYGKPVRAGYPHLQRWGAHLVSRGVAFRDLTRVLEGYSRDAYIDSCCHLDDEAYQFVARGIANDIAHGLAHRSRRDLQSSD